MIATLRDVGLDVHKDSTTIAVAEGSGGLATMPDDDARHSTFDRIHRIQFCSSNPVESCEFCQNVFLIRPITRQTHRRFPRQASTTTYKFQQKSGCQKYLPDPVASSRSENRCGQPFVEVSCDFQVDS